MRGINNDQSPDASLKEHFEKRTGWGFQRQGTEQPRLRCCEVNGPQSAGERVDVEELRQVERSGVMDALEGENKTL